MPTENRSSNTEMVSAKVCGYTPGQSQVELRLDQGRPLPAWLELGESITIRPAEQHQGETVVLPERKGRHLRYDTLMPTLWKGWNACLDEIAKLGPLYPRPVQGEPVVPGHRLDALDALVADGDPQSDANVSNANVAELIRAVRTLQARTITGPAEPSEVERLRTEIRSLRQHKTDYMEASEETRKALLAQLAELKRRHDGLHRDMYTIAASEVPKGCTVADYAAAAIADALSASAKSEVKL